MNSGSRNMFAINMANIRPPISVPDAKAGSRSRRRFTTGACAVSSRATKAIIETSETAPHTEMVVDSNQSLRSPSSRKYSSVARLTESSTMPAKST